MKTTSPTTPTPDEKAEELRHSMSLVRRELDADIEDVSAHAKELADWRTHVQRAPAFAAAAVAVIGYMAVPRKLRVDTVDPDTVSKLAKQQRIVVESKPKAKANAGLGSTMFRLVSGVVMRTAIGYATQRAAAFMEPQNPGQPP